MGGLNTKKWITPRYSDCTAVGSSRGYIKVSGSNLVDVTISAFSTQDCVQTKGRRRAQCSPGDVQCEQTWTILVYMAAE